MTRHSAMYGSGSAARGRLHLPEGVRGRGHRALVRRLSSFPELASCRADDLEALAAAGRQVSLPAHWTFLHEGTPADACYVLLDGEAEVVRRGTNRAVLRPGSVVGEMGLLGHCLRRASVVTTTPVTVLRVDYAALATLLAARPRLAQCITGVYREHADADRPTAR